MRYLVLLFLISCSASHNEVKGYKMPPELEGCKVFVLNNGGFIESKDLYIIKCPSQQPTVSWTRSCGKTCSTVEYVQLIENQ